jgi:hypothetical protein
MSTQPEALRLADEMTEYVNTFGRENTHTMLMCQAVVELRSLHAEVEVLRAATEVAPAPVTPDAQIDAAIEAWFRTAITTDGGRDRGHPFRSRMRAALAAASPAPVAQPQGEPFAFFDPVGQVLRRNPLYGVSVAPRTAWVGEVPLYLAPAPLKMPDPDMMVDMEPPATSRDYWMVEARKAACDGGQCGAGGYCDACPKRVPAPVAQPAAMCPHQHAVDDWRLHDHAAPAFSKMETPMTDTTRAALAEPVGDLEVWGSDKHLTLIASRFGLHALTGKDRVDMLAFGRACIEAAPDAAPAPAPVAWLVSMLHWRRNEDGSMHYEIKTSHEFNAAPFDLEFKAPEDHYDVEIPLYAAPVAYSPCKWRLTDSDNGIWSASCDPKLAYSFTDGGPVENGHRHCHSCGHPLVVTGEAK